MIVWVGSNVSIRGDEIKFKQHLSSSSSSTALRHAVVSRAPRSPSSKILCSSPPHSSSVFGANLYHPAKQYSPIFLCAFPRAFFLRNIHLLLLWGMGDTIIIRPFLVTSPLSSQARKMYEVPHYHVICTSIRYLILYTPLTWVGTIIYLRVFKRY